MVNKCHILFTNKPCYIIEASTYRLLYGQLAQVTLGVSLEE